MSDFYKFEYLRQLETLAMLESDFVVYSTFHYNIQSVQYGQYVEFTCIDCHADQIYVILHDKDVQQLYWKEYSEMLDDMTLVAVVFFDVRYEIEAVLSLQISTLFISFRLI